MDPKHLSSRRVDESTAGVKKQRKHEGSRSAVPQLTYSRLCRFESSVDIAGLIGTPRFATAAFDL